MDQCGGDESMVGPLAPQMVAGDGAEFFINLGQQPIRGRRAVPPGDAGGNHGSLLLLISNHAGLAGLWQAFSLTGPAAACTVRRVEGPLLLEP